MCLLFVLQYKTELQLLLVLNRLNINFCPIIHSVSNLQFTIILQEIPTGNIELNPPKIPNLEYQIPEFLIRADTD